MPTLHPMLSRNATVLRQILEFVETEGYVTRRIIKRRRKEWKSPSSFLLDLWELGLLYRVQDEKDKSAFGYYLSHLGKKERESHKKPRGFRISIQSLLSSPPLKIESSILHKGPEWKILAFLLKQEPEVHLSSKELKKDFDIARGSIGRLIGKELVDIIYHYKKLPYCRINEKGKRELSMSAYRANILAESDLKYGTLHTWDILMLCKREGFITAQGTLHIPSYDRAAERIYRLFNKGLFVKRQESNKGKTKNFTYHLSDSVEARMTSIELWLVAIEEIEEHGKTHISLDNPSISEIPRWANCLDIWQKLSLEMPKEPEKPLEAPEDPVEVEAPISPDTTSEQPQETATADPTEQQDPPIQDATPPAEESQSAEPSEEAVAPPVEPAINIPPTEPVESTVSSEEVEIEIEEPAFFHKQSKPSSPPETEISHPPDKQSADLSIRNQKELLYIEHNGHRITPRFDNGEMFIVADELEEAAEIVNIHATLAHESYAPFKSLKLVESKGKNKRKLTLTPQGAMIFLCRSDSKKAISLLQRMIEVFGPDWSLMGLFHSIEQLSLELQREKYKEIGRLLTSGKEQLEERRDKRIKSLEAGQKEAAKKDAVTDEKQEEMSSAIMDQEISTRNMKARVSDLEDTGKTERAELREELSETNSCVNDIAKIMTQEDLPNRLFHYEQLQKPEDLGIEGTLELMRTAIGLDGKNHGFHWRDAVASIGRKTGVYLASSSCIGHDKQGNAIKGFTATVDGVHYTATTRPQLIAKIGKRHSNFPWDCYTITLDTLGISYKKVGPYDAIFKAREPTAQAQTETPQPEDSTAPASP